MGNDTTNNDIAKIQSFHTKLASKFKRNVNDEKDAKELEDFFNYIAYGKEGSQENPFIKAIDANLRDQLQNSSYIKNLKINYKKDVITPYKLGQYGEEGFAYLINLAILALEKKKLTEKDLNLEEQVKDIIIGDVQATMLSKEILKKIAQEAEKEGNKKLKKSKAFYGLYKKYGVFALKQGKIDINMAQLNLNINSSSQAKRLSKLSASIKNYSTNIIHLEKVSILKSIQAYHYAVTKQRNISKINKEFFKYYIDSNLKDKDNFLPHIQHIVSLYGLTGMGQVYIDKTSKTAVESKLGAKFLMGNIRKDGNIIVIPTSSLGAISLLEGEDKTDVGFRYGGGKEKQIDFPSLTQMHRTVDVSLDISIANQIIKN